MLRDPNPSIDLDELSAETGAALGVSESAAEVSEVQSEPVVDNPTPVAADGDSKTVGGDDFSGSNINGDVNSNNTINSNNTTFNIDGSAIRALIAAIARVFHRGNPYYAGNYASQKQLTAEQAMGANVTPRSEPRDLTEPAQAQEGWSVDKVGAAPQGTRMLYHDPDFDPRGPRVLDPMLQPEPMVYPDNSPLPESTLYSDKTVQLDTSSFYEDYKTKAIAIHHEGTTITKPIAETWDSLDQKASAVSQPDYETQAEL